MIPLRYGRPRACIKYAPLGLLDEDFDDLNIYEHESSDEDDGLHGQKAGQAPFVQLGQDEDCINCSDFNE